MTAKQRPEFVLKFNGMQDGHYWLLMKYLSQLKVQENVGSMSADIIPSMWPNISGKHCMCLAKNFYLDQK